MPGRPTDTKAIRRRLGQLTRTRVGQSADRSRFRTVHEGVDGTMRVIGYARVSTLHQADEGVSLDAQRDRIAGWAGSAGLALDPADVFVDAGISGKRADNRPALRSALEAACSGACVLVVYSLSRLARSVRDTLAIAERLDKAGADLVSLSENINTTSASGKMVFRLLAVLAAFERDLISERTAGALAHKRARSERIGQVPIGHALAEDGRTLLVDEAEARAVGRARAWRDEGRSLRWIAAELTRLGVPTKKGGPRWSASTIADVLKREVRHGFEGAAPTHAELPAPGDHR
jgi:site-specific DNA recombinase